MSTIRDTKILKTLSGKEVEVYTYLTGRETDEIRDAFMGEEVIDVSDKDAIEGQFKKMKMSTALAKSKLTIQKTVVSFDGSAENAFERMRDLPSAEYNDIVAKIGEVTKANFPQAK